MITVQFSLSSRLLTKHCVHTPCTLQLLNITMYQVLFYLHRKNKLGNIFTDNPELARTSTSPAKECQLEADAVNNISLSISAASWVARPVAGRAAG